VHPQVAPEPLDRMLAEIAMAARQPIIKWS
jgi:hypothetical protein